MIAWELSNTFEAGFCLAALDAAFSFGQPEIWNSDQGSQFTSSEILAPLLQRGVSIRMDARGRALDNVNRATVTLSQIRTDLSRRLRQRTRPLRGPATFTLQLPAP